MGISGKKRIHVLLISCLVFGMYALLAARLFHVQVGASEDYVKRFAAQTVRSNHKIGRAQFERGRRGRVFDVRGRVLATGHDAYELWVNPQVPHLPSKVADRLPLNRRVEVLVGALMDLGTVDFDPDQLFTKAIQTERVSRELDENGQPKRVPIVSQRLLYDIQPAEKRHIEEIMRQHRIDNFYFESSHLRAYPEAELTGEIVGYVAGEAGDASGRQKGRSGVEYFLEGVLAGQDGEFICEKDGRLREFDLHGRWRKLPVDGSDVGLTLDVRVQMIVRDALTTAMASVRRQGSSIKALSAVVIETGTGRILALKSLPDLDPGVLYDRDKNTRFDKEKLRCRLVQDVLEPGSTIKPFIMAKALEWGLVRVGDTFETGGGTVVLRHGSGQRPVHDSHANHTVTAWTAVTKSSNIAMAMIGLNRLGLQRVLDVLEQFEFHKRLDLCLPAEAQPLRDIQVLRRTGKPLDQAVSIPYGYAFAMAPIQIPAKFAVFGLDGMYPEPCLVDWVGKGDERQYQERGRRRLIPSHVAETMRRMLADAVESGTGKRHLGDMEWTAAAKTGTAKITGSSPPIYNPSLVAFAPAKNPDITVYILGQHVTGGVYYGADVCGPPMREILEKTLTLRGVPRDRPGKDQE